MIHHILLSCLKRVKFTLIFCVGCASRLPTVGSFHLCHIDVVRRTAKISVSNLELSFANDASGWEGDVFVYVYVRVRGVLWTWKIVFMKITVGVCVCVLRVNALRRCRANEQHPFGTNKQTQRPCDTVMHIEQIFPIALRRLHNL